MGDLRFGAERGPTELFSADFSLRKIPKTLGNRLITAVDICLIGGIPTCAGKPLREEGRMLLKEANLHLGVGEKDRSVAHRPII